MQQRRQVLQILRASAMRFPSVLLLLCIGVATTYAQETQVSLDSAGAILRVDPDLQEKLALFSEYSGFEEARLYRLADSTYALEVFYSADGKSLKKRTIFSWREGEDFRSRLSEVIRERLPEINLDQDGRTALIIGTAVYSLGYYGWAVPIAADFSDSKTSVATYMLIGSAGFFVPYLATSGSRVTAGDASFALGNGQLGIGHGFLFSMLVNDQETQIENRIGYSVAMSVAELIAGYYIADGTGMSAGKADAIVTGGIFGTGLGVGTAYLIDRFDNQQLVGGLGLLGSGLGYLGGTMLAANQHYTTGDAQVLFSTGILGGFIPLALVDATNTEDAKSYFAASMVGNVVGVTAGHMLLRGKNFSTSQGSFILLGEIAGGLLGTGFAYLTGSSQGDNSTLYLSASAVGSLAGFGTMYYLLSSHAGHDDTGSLLQFNFSPLGLAMYARGEQRNFSNDRKVPIFQIQGRF